MKPNFDKAPFVPPEDKDNLNKVKSAFVPVDQLPNEGFSGMSPDEMMMAMEEGKTREELGLDVPSTNTETREESEEDTPWGSLEENEDEVFEEKENELEADDTVSPHDHFENLQDEVHDAKIDAIKEKEMNFRIHETHQPKPISQKGGESIRRNGQEEIAA